MALKHMQATLYDTVNYLDAKQLPGFLVVIELHKAFDTISKNFISESLKWYHFGPNFSR